MELVKAKCHASESQIPLKRMGCSPTMIVMELVKE